MQTRMVMTLAAALACSAASATTYYVDASRPDDSGNGLSWATAKKTIQAAVNLAAAGDIVLVTNGVYATGQTVTPGYACSNRVVITKNITVRSVNGPAMTIIQGQGPLGVGAVRCVFMTNGVLSGFTLTNGFTLDGGDYSYDQCGGGVNMYDGNGAVSNCIISGNRADLDGGGAYYGTVNNSTLSKNSASYGGGASDSTLNSCTISGNYADGDGGGTYMSTLHNCTISGNYADRDGGGTCESTLNNCTLSGNRAMRRGGGSKGDMLNNCTVSGNAALDGDGTYSSAVNNSIVYHNDGENWSGGSFINSCTLPLPAGASNIMSDPLLLDAAHIHASSPCVGAGSAAYASGTDIDGEAWKNPPSMGCDEVYAAGLTGRLEVAIHALGTAAVVGTALEFSAMVRGVPASNLWRFGDNSAVANKAYVAHAWDAAGNYMVILSVFNNDNPAGVTATVHVRVVTLDQMTFYVNAANATPSYPYQSWSTAATTIQDAVDAAETSGIAGARVLVTNGLYNRGERVTPGHGSSNRVLVTKHISVCSVNGPGGTIICGHGPLGDSAVRGVYLCAGLLTGFTVSNGFTRASGYFEFDESGGGVNMYGGNGVVSNCSICGNSAFEAGGGIYKGTVVMCTIDNNDGVRGGGAGYSSVAKCSFSGNRATFGGGACDSIVSNCVFARNSADYGGGVYGGANSACHISGNSANFGGGAALGKLLNCVITNNTGNLGGGAHYCSLTNCLLVSNRAMTGGGGTSYGTAINCSISGNSTTNDGGGTYRGTFINCVVWDNTAARSNNYFNSAFSHSCTTPAAAGAGNISNDPQFVNAAAGDYRLSDFSPCINTGTNQAWMADATDLDGLPRIYGGVVDMGCYEYVPEAGGLWAVGVALFTIYELRVTMWGKRRRVK